MKTSVKSEFIHEFSILMLEDPDSLVTLLWEMVRQGDGGGGHGPVKGRSTEPYVAYGARAVTGGSDRSTHPRRG
jgi:hypothetical protein